MEDCSQNVVDGDELNRTNCGSSQAKLPTYDDFHTGELSGVKVPFFPPLPSEILKFMYGEENIQLSRALQQNIIIHLHEINGLNVEYCGCGGHVLNKRPILEKKEMLAKVF